MAGEISPLRRRGEHTPGPRRRTIAGKRARDLYGLAGEFSAAGVLLAAPLAIAARIAYEAARWGWGIWPL